MPICPQCGEDNPERARFCLACGSSLEAAAPSAGAEERKVVSVLFVDLVGFTASSDRADPEDVRARLRPYHSMLKREIERFGGTVEKFIGDAVMAVFGAPVSHEDDAERSVRCALRIVEAIPELNEQHQGLDLAVRAAVNTGEAVVSLSARPERGEGIVTGDVVNTASRLQGEAPVDGVVVGEVTYRATRDAIQYEGLPPVTVKGKEEPLPIWRAVSARSIYAVEVDRPSAELIGREDDLALLQQTYARTLREESVQLVTVTGEPGVGKSRLVAEFYRFIDDLPYLIAWRQGRCLPYGEGVTFWALGEIVKAQAGILESDGPEEAIAKLAQAVAAVVEEESERDWITARLAPLVGTSVERAGAAEREESFTAWRGFLEAMATRSPVVLVVEDLHWADDAMLGFVEHLADWATGVPLLVVCTARPELYERRPEWGGGKRNSTTIGLSPLSPGETARLIASLLDQAVLPAETQAALLDRAGGNPLYTEEFVRMLVDRGLLERRGATWTIAEGQDIPVPESVQAIIAARLDTLPADRKALLHDASVVGKTFWSGALTAMSGTDEANVRTSLHDLARKELVRPVRRSSVEGQAEYSFWHLLVRDVAYGQIPRSARAAKHGAAAEWIEAMVGDRVADHAEMIAHHYLQALELATASSAETNLEDLKANAARFLTMAGDRAMSLDLPKAFSHYSQALELVAADHPGRAQIMVKTAEARAAAGQIREALRANEAALAQFRRLDDPRGAGLVLAEMSRHHWQLGETARSQETLAEAFALLEPLGPGPELARAYLRRAAAFMISARSRDTLEWSDKALTLCEEFGLESLAMRARQHRGVARVELGDLGGGDDLKESVRLGHELGLGLETVVAYVNYADFVWESEGAAKGLEVMREGIEFGKRRGILQNAMWASSESTWMLFELGEWDEVLSVCEEIVAWDASRGGSQISVMVLTSKGRVLVERGLVQEAALLAEDLLPQAREITDPQILVPVLGLSIRVRALLGEQREVFDLVDELDEVTKGLAGWAQTFVLPDVLRGLVAFGATDRALPLLEGFEGVTDRIKNSVLTARAVIAEAGGHLEQALTLHTEAAERWADFGHTLEQGHALIGAGRCLLELGRSTEATARLREARELLVSLGARPSIEETDLFLERATALTS